MSAFRHVGAVGIFDTDAKAVELNALLRQIFEADTDHAIIRNFLAPRIDPQAPLMSKAREFGTLHYFSLCRRQVCKPMVANLCPLPDLKPKRWSPRIHRGMLGAHCFREDVRCARKRLLPVGQGLGQGCTVTRAQGAKKRRKSKKTVAGRILFLRQAIGKHQVSETVAQMC